MNLNLKDRGKNTPLHFAAVKGADSAIMIAFLERIKRPSDLLQRNTAGHNALDLAVAKGHEMTVELLVEMGRLPVE